jgi:diadenylate cyclase
MWTEQIHDLKMARPNEQLQELDLRSLASQYKATFIHVIGEELETVRKLVAAAPGPCLVSTWKDEVITALRRLDGNLKLNVLAHEVTAGINALNQIRDVVLAAFVEGHFGPNDRVLNIVKLGNHFECVLFFDMRYDESVTRLKKELEDRAEIRVIETVLQIASEIAREGREKGHVGTIFVIGDTDRVLQASRQVVINPFKGHTEEDRNILNPATWETAKEFSQIDGAFLVRENGLIEAAGRYIEVKNPVSLPSGLGGRHLASAAVTKETRAIAVTVSETGVIRIFKDGEILMRIGTT